MSIESLTNFLENSTTDPADAWIYEAVKRLAGLQPPSYLLGEEEPLLKGDQHRLWLRWFIEGIASPQSFARDESAGRLEMLEVVVRRVRSLFPGADADRHKDLANRITDHLFAEVERLRTCAVRDYARAETRLSLIQEVVTPRCYLCGYEFTPEAIAAFLRVKGRNPIPTPIVLDVLRPRGLDERDQKIEIEHVVPVAAGGSGQDNLRLACGWCNKYKSSRVSIYEASFLPSRTEAFRLGPHRINELPHPFWSIRILALRGKCQHHEGCRATASEAELFVALRDWSGSPNPTNLAVYCATHDPIAALRKQPFAAVRDLWRARTR